MEATGSDMVTTVAGVCDILFGMRRCMINLPNRCQRLISRAEWHTVRLKGASGESEGLRRYDKENLLWQSTVAIRSDPVGSDKRTKQRCINRTNLV